MDAVPTHCERDHSSALATRVPIDKSLASSIMPRFESPELAGSRNDISWHMLTSMRVGIWRFHRIAAAARIEMTT